VPLLYLRAGDESWEVEAQKSRLGHHRYRAMGTQRTTRDWVTMDGEVMRFQHKQISEVLSPRAASCCCALSLDDNLELLPKEQ
jgi:hypothetical protein